MIDVTVYQFILADNNQTMQFCPVFLYFSKSGFNVQYFTFILSIHIIFIIKFKLIFINKFTMFPKSYHYNRTSSTFDNSYVI